MMKFFISCLIALLPLQSSWARVASYSVHVETVDTVTLTETTHAGHHEHDYNGKAIPSYSDPVQLNIGTDADCSVCHVACCTAVPPISATPAIAHITSTNFQHNILLNFPDTLDSIDRPVWQRRV